MAENIKDRILKRLQSPEIESAPAGGIPVQEVRIVSIPAKELIEAINANPDHPIAKALVRSTSRKKPMATCCVEAADLEALVTGKQTEVYQDRVEVVDGFQSPILRKRVVEAHDPDKSNNFDAEPGQRPEKKTAGKPSA